MIRRSFALRAALGAAGLMLLASLLGAGWVWYAAEQELRAQRDLALAAEAEALIREYEILGVAGLAEQARAVARRQGPILVLLQTIDGIPIAGNFPGVRPPVLRGFATFPGGTADAGVRALGTMLPPGMNLILAAELAPISRAATRLAWAPAFAAGCAAIIALLLGYVAARRIERRIAGVGAAARAIMDGDLTRRLPQAGEGDEFDRLAGTLNTMLGRIEALMQAQRQVTDDIAHDLRTPLARLRQRIESALASARDPDADAATLEESLTELDQVLATFAALLRIARAESGAPRAGFRPIDLSGLVGAVAEAYEAVAEEAGRTLSQDIAPGIGMDGDAALLRQAVANLLDNALVHGGPHVGLRLGPGPVIEVTDDGPGIPPEEREAVTRRFHRLDASRNTPGTGLGLALVAATAKLHGGRFEVLDGPGGWGATMRLTLGGR